MGSLFLVRHATTADSAAGRNLGQSRDLPLADAGRALAEALAASLTAELLELPHDELRLVSSPARRCRETMAPVARVLGVGSEHIELERGLLEIDYGAWDGLTADESLARDPELRGRWLSDPYRTCTPGGESGADVAARAMPVVERLTAWAAADRSRVAIVVAHNHVNRVVLAQLLGWPMADYRRRLNQDPGGYSLVSFSARGRGSVLRRINATPSAEALRGEIESLPV